MLHLEVAHPGRPRESCFVSSFPFVIGKSAQADLRLDAPGVWDQHATLDLVERRFQIASSGEAILLVNGQPGSSVLKNGDTLTVGGCTIFVTLAPVEQSRLLSREVFTWTLIVLVFVLEVISVVVLR